MCRALPAGFSERVGTPRVGDKRQPSRLGRHGARLVPALGVVLEMDWFDNRYHYPIRIRKAKRSVTMIAFRDVWKDEL